MSSNPPRIPTPSASRVAAAVREVVAAVDLLADLALQGALAGLPGPASVALAESVHRAGDRLAAVSTVATGVVHQSDAAAAEGFASTRAWLQLRCRRSESEASALVGSALDPRGDYLATGEAWLAGEVPGAAVRVITREVGLGLRALPVAERAVRREDAEGILLEVARRAPVRDVTRAAKHLRFVTDPDGMRQAALDAFDEQHLRLTSAGAGFDVRGYLSAETAAALTAVLQSTVDHWYRSGELAPDDQPDAHGSDDPSASRRRRLRRPHLLALALGHLATRLLDAGAVGTHHGVRPHVTLTVDLDHLAAGLGGQLHVTGHDDPVLLPPDSIRRLLCDADLHPVVTARAPSATPDDATWRRAFVAHLTDAARSVLYLGRTQRTAPPRLRRALEVRDRHCAFPGCRIGTDRAQAHHVTEWEHGGTTDIATMVLLCHRHHHAVHEGGWSISPTPGIDPRTNGCWTFSPPPRRKP